MKLKLVGTVIAGLLATQASATVLFTDDFQSNLSQWASPGSAQIVSAPGGGSALAFAANGSGGDLFSAPISDVSGNYRITFQYLGACVASSCGGYLGFDNASGETWLAGDGPYPSTNPILNTAGWQTISFNFSSASAFKLKIEDWGGASDGAPGNAYFRDLTISTVPEPATWALMIAGFGMIGFAARRRVAAVTG